ncbi:CBS domain-containing protein [Flavobacteriaceae bacterium MAR_2010_72]|nr:CBS domain-containing protein [Flavobacteriaceae bacterium MAR_2010_72]
MKNTIAERIADFLKQFPPFDLLDPSALLEISKEVKIKYLEKGKTIYNQGDPLHDHFYIINKGAISLIKDIDTSTDVIDKFDEGDVFGLRPLFAKETYTNTARTDEETILYSISIHLFRPMAIANTQIGNYLIESFASNTKNPYSKEHHKSFYSNAEVVSTEEDHLFELQPVRYIKKVVTAKPSTKIRRLASLMSEKNISSILIENKGIPVGIITDKDLRTKVATGLQSIDDSANSIMSAPVLCYPKNITIAQAQITMMKHRVGHICITEDGTPNTKIIGLVANHDMVVMKGSNPAVLMKAIKRANSTKELKRIRSKIMILLDGYITQNIPLTHTSKIIFELNDATIKRVIERCIAKMETPPPVNFAWMSLGSQGRKEQLLHTDQDNAIVFETVDPKTMEATRAYFLKLSKKVNKRLNAIGFEFCDADIMAKNPNYCLSLEEWKQQFSSWTSNTGSDEILLSSIFFDFDISYGDANLTNALSEHTLNLVKNNNLFISKLAASALRSASPLGFFRQFLVESDGEYKDLFDLKKRALLPLIDAGRVLTLNYQVKTINNTAERFEKLAELFPEDKDLYLSCSYAFKALLKFRTKHGLINNDNGRFIKLAVLTKEEKMKLKRCFKTISTLQETIKIKFNLGALL